MRTYPHLALLLAPLALAPFAVAACGSDGGGAATTTSWPVVTTTSVPLSTTSTSTTSTSTTSTSTTSTTIAAVLGLELSAQGLGDALFGASDDGVYAYVQAIVGDPTADSGWVDPLTTGAVCPGSEVRFVTWNDLVLTFTDDSPAGSGYRHFAGYAYGPAFGEQALPAGLETEGGIGIGDPVSDLRAVYPGVVVNPADEMSGPSFYIEEGLLGFLTGTGDDDLVMSFVGGFGCGE